MGKHLWLYCTALIILTVAASSAVSQTEPGLVGYWPFDGDALDSSGNGRHGELGGDPQFVPGMYGNALEFDGDDSVTITGYKGIEGTNPFSIAAWIKTENTATTTIVTWGSTANGAKIELRTINDVLRANHGAGNLNSRTVVNDGQWHHIVLTVAANSTVSYPQMILYVDGKDDTVRTTDADPPLNIIPTFDVGIGWRSTNSDRYWVGLMDEVRIYDRVLTAAEVAALALWSKAHNPTPADGEIGVTDPLLRWVPREASVFRDVYLSTEPEIGPADLVSRRQVATMYWHMPGLVPGTGYYWRVDEIDPDGTVHQGDVWSFVYADDEAWAPFPADGEPYTDPGLTLSWRRGLTGVSHDLYFGTDQAAVADGTGDTFKGNQFTTAFDTGDLAIDTTYYWRVDEVDAAGVKTTGHVWTFKTLPEILIDDPNLMCWWQIDEGLGSRLVDWSGHGNHGQFNGAPLWVDGYDGPGLELDGIDDSVVKSFDAAEDWSEMTVSLWVKAALLGQDTFSSPFTNHYPNSAGFQIDVDGGNPGSYRINPSGILFGTVRTEWVHLAVTAVGTAAKVYYNGVWTASGTLNDMTFNRVAIGLNRNATNWFAGTIDDVRVFDRELSQEELELIMRIDPLRAWQPSPADGALADVRTATPLTWARGDSASKHDVYLGTDAAAVAAADASDTTGVYRGRISATSHTPLAGLEWGRKYFWRVDELNADGSLTKGRLWSFTVADYLIVDDFESYTNESPNRVFQTWIDGLGFSPDVHFPDGDPGNGSGAMLGHDIWSIDSPYYNGTIMEMGNVFSGRQAAPMDYNNAISPYYCEIERTWATAQDWTFNGVGALVVHFRGEPVDFLQTAPDAIVMSAAGADIWGMSDEFRFVFKRLNGDGSIIARVDSLVDTHASAKAGVMIRESLEPDSRYAAVEMTPRSGVAFQRRLATGSDAIGTSEAGVVAPRWVKLTRTGNELVAQHSADGVTWGNVTHATNPTSDTVVMGGTIYIGLALTSHSADNATTAQFSGIQTTGGVSGQWQVADIGVAHPGNSPETLYVAVEDSGGRTAVIPHPDPAATTLDTWQRWTIDLADLVAKGVNLRSIKKMMIGVGDRDNPQPDGAGTMYFDDFRIVRTPSVTLAPSTDLVATGDKGMILSIGGIDVNDLLLGTTSFAGASKYPDQGPRGADNFDLNAAASGDDQAYVDVVFAEPVTTILLAEKGGDDAGFIQALDDVGFPVGEPVAFSPDSFGKPGYIVYQDEAGALMVITADVPIRGIRILPPAGGPLGIDPVSVCGIPAW